MSTRQPVKVIFVCIGNTCRSQMAEGFARLHGKDRIEARSAGTSAMGYVNEDTIEAMSEVEVDISSQTSKQLTDDMLDWADVVITLGCCCADELCPVTFKGIKQDWPIEDPLGRPPAVIRRVRDDIERRVVELIESLCRMGEAQRTHL